LKDLRVPDASKFIDNEAKDGGDNTDDNVQYDDVQYDDVVGTAAKVNNANGDKRNNPNGWEIRVHLKKVRPMP